jgi:VWFA-related protein
VKQGRKAARVGQSIVACLFPTYDEGHLRLADFKLHRHLCLVCIQYQYCLSSEPERGSYSATPKEDSMFTRVRFAILLTVFVSNVISAFAQKGFATVPSLPQSIRLNVHVAPKSGPEEIGLQAQDFTVLDNKAAQPILSFKAIAANQEPVKVILLIDAVNTDFSRVAYTREQVQKFLKSNQGQLEYPTAIAVLTDRGTQIQKEFTNNGNLLSSSLDHDTIGLREVTRNSGIWGANERVDISLRAVREVIAYASSLPGRKILLWISPGWPLLSGARVQLDAKQQNQIFSSVVAFSTELQQSNVTLYSVNPLGVDESIFRADYYQDFVKGVTNSKQTDLADLSLQVLSVQSGGLALNGSNDIVGGLKTCFADVQSWYEITVPVSRAEQRNEYHQLEIKIDKPGLVARTRDGYYAQP